MNNDALAYLALNYKTVVQKAMRFCGRQEVAEDCVSMLTTKLLKKEYNIKHVSSFINRAVFYEVVYYNKKNNKYNLNAEVPEVPAVDYLSQHIAFERLLNTVKSTCKTILSKKEKEAVNRLLDTGFVQSTSGNKNTNKAQFHTAICKLKHHVACNREAYGF